MSQADSPNTTSPSRRALLAGAPAVAVAGLAAGTVVNVLAIAEAKASTLDPIHALIAEHIEAVKADHQANKIWGSIPANLPEYDAAEEVVTKTGARSRGLLMELLCARATTLEGVAALLAHVGRPEFLEEDPEHPNFRETLLSSMNEYSSHELNRHGQDFPVRLAETLRSLIAAA
jgi:hypothetical protein